MSAISELGLRMPQLVAVCLRYRGSSAETSCPGLYVITSCIGTGAQLPTRKKNCKGKTEKEKPSEQLLSAVDAGNRVALGATIAKRVSSPGTQPKTLASLHTSVNVSLMYVVGAVRVPGSTFLAWKPAPPRDCVGRKTPMLPLDCWPTGRPRREPHPPRTTSHLPSFDNA